MKICVWPDYDWCYKDELHEYGWKSDDYEEVDIPYDVEDEDDIEAIVYGLF